MSEDSIFSRFRAWMNEGSGKLVVTLVALGVLAGAVAIWIMRGDKAQETLQALEQKGFKVLYFCPACKAGGDTTIAKDQNFPVPCPKCKQPAVRGVRCVGRCGQVIQHVQSTYWSCPVCGYIFDFRINPTGLPDEALPK